MKTLALQGNTDPTDRRIMKDDDFTVAGSRETLKVLESRSREAMQDTVGLAIVTLRVLP